jgi:uncharacterized membrane protein
MPRRPTPERPTSSPGRFSSIPFGAALGLVALVVVWGLSIPLTKLALAETGPLTLTALRYVAAVLCFVFVLAGNRVPPAPALMRMAGLGALGIGIGQVAQALGVQRANASVATIISALIPLLVLVFAVLRLRQRIRPVYVVGLLWRSWAWRWWPAADGRLRRARALPAKRWCSSPRSASRFPT